jgi:hypothetical protein
MESNHMQIKRITALVVAPMVAGALISSLANASTETVFPRANRILKPVVPAECKEWTAPLPDRKTNVEYPTEAPGLKGSAALLVRIGKSGEYLGVTDFIADHDAYVRAAATSMKDWTFKPAVCNGESMASEARVDFEFRREGGITYGSDTGIRR